MQNGMEEITSLQFDSIEENLQLMLQPLKSDQEFLRYVLNLNDFPLEQAYIDSSGNLKQQPDIPMPFDLVGSQTVLLTLFNQNILTNSKVQIFFSPLNGVSAEGDPIFHNKYTVDIVIPYSSMVINSTGKLRMFRIANRIAKAWGNKYIAGIGKTILYSWKTYVVDTTFQGINLMFKVDDSAFTDEDN